ncbi:hypothetical protein D3C84_1111410 [compost metagenome]
MVGLVQAFDQMIQTATAQRLLDALLRVMLALMRIAQCSAQGANRQIRFLRQKQAIGRQAQMPATERPQSAQGTQQGALAAARGAAEQHVLACRDVQRSRVQ